MTTERDETRRISGGALRTLHALELTLRRHIAELMALGCEDAEAAEAIVFAIETAEKVLDTTRVTRRKVMEG